MFYRGKLDDRFYYLNDSDLPDPDIWQKVLVCLGYILSDIYNEREK